jgi:hypothetical protein
VQADRTDGELVVSVTDTGIGIPPELREKIFEAFYQADGKHRGKSPGTGLGLALARRFVEMHGGSIRAESRGEGKGSRFCVTLPLRPGAGTAGRKPPPAGDRDPSGRIPETPDRGSADLAGVLERALHRAGLLGEPLLLCRLYPEIRVFGTRAEEVMDILGAEIRGQDLRGIDREGHVHLILTGADPAEADGACARIVGKLEERFRDLNVSFETAAFPWDGKTPGELLARFSR